MRQMRTLEQRNHLTTLVFFFAAIAVMTAACADEPPNQPPISDEGDGGTGGSGGMAADSCAHDLCVVGEALDPACDLCVAAVCEAEGYCCGAMDGSWVGSCVADAIAQCDLSCEGVCLHDTCEVGLALDPTCDSCAASVCDIDPFCCNDADGSWDDACVQQSKQSCGQECPGACAHAPCTMGDALDPNCSDCVAAVCAGDPWCCDAVDGTWDSLCVSQAGYLCGGTCAPTCGDGGCDYGESQLSCPQDCGADYCGDGQCDLEEDAMSCPADCGGFCGDMICAPPETLETCFLDCSGFCGDGECGSMEDATACPLDCGGTCGNMACDADENAFTCPIDRGFCGDAICALPAENVSICPSDCVICGDGICSPPGETLASCPQDCGYCGDGTCTTDESVYSCNEDCGSCGDGSCLPPELPHTCPADCEPSVCGDGVCNSTENPATCPADCPITGTQYTLWIHGRLGPGDTPLAVDPTNFSYWGPTTVAHGQNPIAVNWGGKTPIAGTSFHIRNALDCYCTGDNWCTIAVHSTGDLQIGYALANYGQSARPVTDATPNSVGQCGIVGGNQQGWNIEGVFVAGGVSGGSELAAVAVATGIADVPLDVDLQVPVARAMYDHNNTAGHTFQRYAGSRKLTSLISSGILPGQDDGAVAYHSSGGLSVAAAFCNPTENCGTSTEPSGALQLGSQGSTLSGSGPDIFVPKWQNHTVVYRDLNGDFNHLGGGQWGGIIGRMLGDVVAASQ